MKMCLEGKRRDFWCGLPCSQAIRVEKLQLKVAKAIVRRRNLSHPQVLRAAELPTLSCRRRGHCLSVPWNLMKGIGPPALLDSLPALASTRSVSALRAGTLCSSHFAPHLATNPLSFVTLFLSGIICLPPLSPPLHLYCFSALFVTILLQINV